MPEIAVLIAAKDAGDYVIPCIDSVLAQELPFGWTLRILLGVDGCLATAKSAARLQPGIVVRFSPLSIGPYAVFNRLSAETRADLLCRFDADDVMMPGYLSSHIYMLSASSLRVDIVRSWSIFTDASLRPTRAALAGGSFTGLDGRRRRGSDGQFTMVQAVWRRLGGFRPWPCNADSEFLVRARAAGFNVVDLPAFTYLRRVHCASLTNRLDTNYASLRRRTFEHFTANQRTAFARGEAVPAVSDETGFRWQY